MILKSLVQVQSSPMERRASNDTIAPIFPVTKTQTQGSPSSPQMVIEMQNLPDQSHVSAPTELNGPVDLEMSRPPSPAVLGDVARVVPSAWSPYMNRFRLLSVCICIFADALSDGAAGALIPYMEKYVNPYIF